MKKTRRQLDLEIAAELARPSLVAGDEAWAILTRKIGDNAKGNDRREVTGAARVRVIVAHGGTVRALVLAASGIPAGREIELRRGDVYANKSKDERRKFRAEVDRFWGPNAHRK